MTQKEAKESRTRTDRESSVSSTIHPTLIIGRYDEKAIIYNTVNRIAKSETNARAEALIVSGPSGYGKSALIDDVANTFRDNEIIWVSAKFDQYDNGCRPFSAFADATDDLCQKVVEDAHATACVKMALSKGELSILGMIVPAICTFLPVGYEGPSGTINEHTFVTFVRLYRRLLKAICSVKAVVFAIDDLQWYDDLSLQLLEALAKDSSLTSFLLLGSVRIDPEGGIFDLLSGMPMQTNHLTLAPFALSSTIELVAKSLYLPYDDAVELGAVVQKRAEGNPFFSVQFIEELKRTKLLRHRKPKSCYDIDIEGIARKIDTEGTSSTVMLVSNKIAAQGLDVQLVLFLAAHLGFRFKCSVIESLVGSKVLVDSFLTRAKPTVDKADECSTSAISGLGALQQAVKSGLVESGAHGTYQFSHDNIQQCAASILGARERYDVVVERLGTVLLELIRKDEEDNSLLFAAARILSKQKGVLGKEGVELFLRAAKAASVLGGFKQAAKYTDAGIRNLDSSGWSSPFYETRLELHSFGAEMHYASGNMIQSRKRVASIVKHAHKTEDQFRSQRVLMDILSSQGHWDECVIAGSRFLRTLGINAPRSPGKAHVVMALAKVKLLLGRRSASDLEGLPKTKKPVIIEAMRLLTCIAEASWHNGERDRDRMAYLCLLSFQLLLQHGLSDVGIYTLVGFGIVLSHLGDFKEASNYGNLAMKLSKQPGAEVARSMISPACHTHLWYLCNSIRDTPTDMMAAHSAAIRCGDIYHASAGLRTSLPFRIITGSLIEERKKHFIEAREFLRDYKQAAHWDLVAPWAQFSECLEQPRNDSLSLAGSFMDQDDLLLPYCRGENRDAHSVMIVIMVHYCRMMMLVVLREDEVAMKTQQKYRSLPFEMSSFHVKYQNYFHCALACLGLAKQGKRRYIRKAKHFKGFLQRASSAGSPLLHSMLLLLDAEQSVVTNGVSEEAILRQYRKAAACFLEERCYLYHAMTLERAGDWCSSVGAITNATDFLTRAHDQYKSYGALVKLPALLEQFPDILCMREQTPNEIAERIPI